MIIACWVLVILAAVAAVVFFVKAVQDSPNGRNGNAYRYLFCGGLLILYAFVMALYLRQVQTDAQPWKETSSVVSPESQPKRAFQADYFANAYRLGGKLYVLEEKGTGLAFLGQLQDGYLVGCTQLLNADGTPRTIEQEMQLLENNQKESDSAEEE